MSSFDPLALQGEMQKWVDHNFPEHSPLENAVGLGEEAGELQRAILKLHRGIRGTRREWHAEIQKEIGDVIICAIFIANDFGIQWADALQARWNVIRKRDWQADKIQHGISSE